MTAAPIAYEDVLTHAGFYRQGRPLPDLVYSAEELLAVPGSPGEDVLEARRQIERAFRYQAVLRPEGRLGLTDVYELSGSPCIYFKRLDADLDAERLLPRLFAWHRAAWNHGQAPMLWIVSPTQVRILDAYARPPEEPGLDSLRRIEIARFERIAERLEELREKAARHQVESGLFWQGLGKKIDRAKRVDQQLIKDLTSVAERLGGCGLELAEAHQLLLRSVFASYLGARGWLRKDVLREAVGVTSFVEALASPRSAGRMFEWLAKTFNGDVFPEGSSTPYTAAQLAELRFLLEGGDPKSGQRYLWPYEFDVLPVELLSSIYESFAHALEPAEARRRGMHYTPVNLVDLALSQVFDDTLFDEELPLDARVLDLACGSGVFLVEALRRLVGRRLAAGQRLSRKLIRDTLYRQVFGVDTSPGAVHVAAVSLYLAALELDPHPRLGNGVKFEPLIRPRDPKKSSRRRSFNLFEADAFDTGAAYNRQPPFADRSVDVVVGNPPWTRPKGARAGSGPSREEELSHVAYCRERSIPLPFQRPPDQAFVYRAADFATPAARFGFFLSARRFFSDRESTRFSVEALLKRFVPRLAVNLSSLHREDVFPTAKHPSMLLISRNRIAERGAEFVLVAPDRRKDFKRHGTIEIDPVHLKTLSVQRAASEEGFLKVASWGSARDVDLINHLRLLPPLGEVAKKIEKEAEKRIRLGQGFIKGKTESRKKDVSPKFLEKELPCLENAGFTPFEFDVEGLDPFAYERLERLRSEELYEGPRLLVRLAPVGSRFVASLCPVDAVYSRRYEGVRVIDEYRAWYSCVLGILNSSTMTYFMLMTSAEWGVERNNIYSEDVYRLPVPTLESEGSASVKRVARLTDRLRDDARRSRPIVEADLKSLDRLVFDLYGLSSGQRVLIEDLVDSTLDLYRKVEASKHMLPTPHEELVAYAERFTGVVDGYLAVRGASKLVTEIYGLPDSTPLRVVKLRLVDRSSDEPALSNVPMSGLEPLLERIAETLPDAMRERLHTRRYLRIYGEDELYVVKPNQRRFWTRSAGLNDADAVLAEHLRHL